MKLLKTVLLILLGYSTTGLIAQESRFKEGETLNVWASSGLNMREKPDAKSLKLTTIPYGAKVIVQPNIGVKIPFEVEEFKGFIVKGYWLLVKYGNTEGFVFDGFLSRLPAPNEVYLLNYLNKKIGVKGDKFFYDKKEYYEDIDLSSLSKKKVDDKYKGSYYQKYNYDILYVDFCPNALFSVAYQIPNISLYEGYRLIMKKWNEKINTSYDKKNKTISISTNDENGCSEHTSIKLKDNKIIIHIAGGC